MKTYTVELIAGYWRIRVAWGGSSYLLPARYLASDAGSGTNAVQVTTLLATPSDAVYRLITQGASSARYGPCEVCGDHVAEVFTATNERTHVSTFGHERCLRERFNAPLEDEVRA